jgi:hypothetical protein
VLGAVHPGQLDAFLARRATGGHAILLDTATWDPASGRAGSAANAATVLRRSGWRVAVAQAGDPLDQVWADLVAGTS